MRYRICLGVAVLVAAAAVLVWATTPCGQHTGTGAKSCPGGSLTLVSTHCLGVTWSACGDGHFNTVTLQLAGPGVTNLLVSVDSTLSNNVYLCWVRVDSDPTWYSVLGVWRLFQLGAGTHTFTFWSRPADRDTLGNTVAKFHDQGATIRYFGWMNLARVSGNPGSCPDPACP